MGIYGKHTIGVKEWLVCFNVFYFSIKMQRLKDKVYIR